MLGVVARRDPALKLPLDLVKRVAAHLLGPSYDKKATVLEIADEGRCWEWDEDEEDD
jgi:hypothetical protein